MNIIEKLSKYIVSLGKVGFIKPASGTWGTLASMPVAFLIAYIYSPSSLIIASFITLIVGWYFTNIYEKTNNKHDANEVVIDEMAGLFITLSFIPVNVWYYIAGFLIFRFFDIFKPYPINLIDEQKTAFSVMFDDIIAGLYAGITLWIILWIFH